MSKLVKRLFIAGAGLTVLPFLAGILITVLSMISAFHRLGQNGITDPKLLAGDIGHSLMATFVGIMVSFVGVVVLIVACVLYGIARSEKQLEHQGVSSK